jgi:hypothetical protein
MKKETLMRFYKKSLFLTNKGIKDNNNSTIFGLLLTVNANVGKMPAL